MLFGINQSYVKILGFYYITLIINFINFPWSILGYTKSPILNQLNNNDNDSFCINCIIILMMLT